MRKEKKSEAGGTGLHFIPGANSWPGSKAPGANQRMLSGLYRQAFKQLEPGARLEAQAFPLRVRQALWSGRNEVRRGRLIRSIGLLIP